ncbi:MAG: alpha/beta fold hydrolase [Betaproteobacteria bacterium]
MIESTETIARFGADERLLGIVTLPAQRRADAPACLLMNAGVVHRIGPHRLNVKIARALAAIGIASIRIDLSGLGDSPSAPGAAHSGEQTVRDLQDAMAHLEQTLGVQRFIVFGLCSGSVHAYWLAQKDERVVGMTMFDSYVFPTFKTHLLRRWSRLRTLSWRSLARKPLEWLRRSSRAEQPAEVSDDQHMALPSRAQFAQAMNALTARGVSVYLYYSASFIETFNYHGQLRDNFGDAPFMRRIRYDYETDVDHTVTSQHAQRKVVASIADWAQSVAGGNSGSST